ncbi:MAG: HAD family phosphatase [Pseudomonadota bacterium]
MTAPDTIEALILDNDGVIVDSERFHIEAERRLLAEAGLEFDHDAYCSAFVGLSHSAYLRAVERSFQRAGYAGLPDDFEARLLVTAEVDVLEALTAIADIEQVLDVMGPRPVAVASSARVGVLRAKLERVGLLSALLPHVYSAELVERGKPAPDLFLLAADRLGVAPHRCVVVEDSVHGIRAARAAGMLAFGFTGGSHADTALEQRLFAAGANQVFSTHVAVAKAISSGRN